MSCNSCLPLRLFKVKGKILESAYCLKKTQQILQSTLGSVPASSFQNYDKVELHTYFLKMLCSGHFLFFPSAQNRTKMVQCKIAPKTHAISTVVFVWPGETAMPLRANSAKNQAWWQNNARNYESKAIEERSGRGGWIWHVVWSQDCSQRKGQTKNMNKYCVSQTSRTLHRVRMTDCSVVGEHSH